LVTEVKGTQTRAIFGGAVPIEVIVSLVSEMDNKYIDALLGLKGSIPVHSKALTSRPTEANLL
jgi:hypothetical protein